MTVTATFTVQFNGDEQVFKAKDVDYKDFWFAQDGVIQTINMTNRWGLGQALGQPDPLAGVPTDGNVSIHMVADFGGANSRAFSEWNGIPGPAAAEIHKSLVEALSTLK